MGRPRRARAANAWAPAVPPVAPARQPRSAPNARRGGGVAGGAAKARQVALPEAVDESVEKMAHVHSSVVEEGVIIEELLRCLVPRAAGFSTGEDECDEAQQQLDFAFKLATIDCKIQAGQVKIGNADAVKAEKSSGVPLGSEIEEALGVAALPAGAKLAVGTGVPMLTLMAPLTQQLVKLVAKQVGALKMAFRDMEMVGKPGVLKVAMLAARLDVTALGIQSVGVLATRWADDIDDVHTLAVESQVVEHAFEGVDTQVKVADGSDELLEEFADGTMESNGSDGCDAGVDETFDEE
ncbi:unnamed protein product [Prorocentrum cordatum]|uniref:Uncharacterized protein n=1 Tax=Prorocentrum cordatum TaxID=2364126 RepID=A0ABN9XCE7_9DINO|nr:unnamed protein product [Polarella glacialis]